MEVRCSHSDVLLLKNLPSVIAELPVSQRACSCLCMMWDCGMFHMELSILRSIVPKGLWWLFSFRNLWGFWNLHIPMNLHIRRKYVGRTVNSCLWKKIFLSIFWASTISASGFLVLFVLRDRSNRSIYSAFHNLIPRCLGYVQESDFWRVILNPLWSVQWAHPHKEFDTGCDIWIEASTSPAEPCSPLRHGGARGLRRRRQSVATSGARNSHISYIQRPV